ANLHCQANPMEHEPCGFLSDAKSAANFVGTDAILAVRNHPHSDKPLVEWQSGILKNRADLHAELFASMLALTLPETASRKKANFLASASGAGDAIRPSALNH